MFIDIYSKMQSFEKLGCLKRATHKTQGHEVQHAVTCAVMQQVSMEKKRCH